MRRWLGVLPAAAQIIALCCGMARANITPIAMPPIDLSAQIFARVFGESSDRRAAFSAERGSAMAESPLRDLAFTVKLAPSSSDSSEGDVINISFTRPGISLSEAAYVPQTSVLEQAAGLDAAPPLTLGYYRDAGPAPTTAPSERRFEISTYEPQQPALPALDQIVAGASLPLNVGHLHVTPHAEALQAQSSDLSLNDQALNAGATVNVRAGKRSFGLDFSSDYEHLAINGANLTTGTFDPASTTGMATDTVPMFAPSYADVSKRTLGTALTVPLSRSLTGSLQFDTQRLLGGFGAPGLSNLDENNTIYGARLTYQLPKSSSAISLSASQFHFQNNLIPTNAFVQTAANVDFTVKF